MKTLRVLILTASLQAISSNTPAASYTNNLAFATQGQGMWGSGGSNGFDVEMRLLGTSWDLSGGASSGFAHPHGDGVKGSWPRICAFGGCIGGGEYVISEGWDLGTWGMDLGGHTAGQAGLYFRSNFDNGRIAVDYPIQASFTLPDKARPGQQITLSSAYTLSPDAQLKTRSPSGAVELSLDTSFSAAVGGTACLGGCYSGTVPLGGGASRSRLVGLSSNELGGSVEGALAESLPYGGSAHMPLIQTQGGLQGSVLRASGSDRFLAANVNLSQIVSAALGIPLNGSVQLGSLAVGYKTIDLSTGLGLSLDQSFTFEAEPWVRYLLSGGQELTARLGDDISLTMPDVAGELVITPTVFLKVANLTNVTRLSGDAALDLSALQASAGLEIPSINVFGLGTVGGGSMSAGFGPVLSAHVSAPLGGGIGLFEDTWQLGGFQALQAGSMSVLAVPEPGSRSMLITGGLLCVGVAWRRHTRA
ncbi:hypothetical protein [Pelomonas cellulosilytica]|uniref:PEP-CTERM protein-sorting domain-containing protein n=1 Tax=Pelomonas cellulosilytica TaxID=2906762 RepID=A0ABS8XNY7_9BURK|nr:hypothetical protein [Pelomonas sp. P8]MCE4554486.1 hypothetical protein [Pelomonas sp. P8]